MIRLIVVLTLVPAMMPAQLQKPPEPPPKSSDLPMVVKGCVSGKRLTHPADLASDVPAQILRATEFVLDGPKELLTQIRREHTGHYDEITGFAKLPPNPGNTTAEVRSKRVGKGGTVTLGVRQEGELKTPDLPIRLKVESLRHIAERCVAR
jgi:hypothetical protein